MRAIVFVCSYIEVVMRNWLSFTMPDRRVRKLPRRENIIGAVSEIQLNRDFLSARMEIRINITPPHINDTWKVEN